MTNSKHKSHKNFKIRPVIPLDSLAHTAFIGAKYHLDKIIELSASPCIQTMWQDDDSLDTNKKKKLQADVNQFYWHVRAFFWELIASFDVILQWVNVKYDLGVEEQKVLWKKIAKEKSKSELLQVDWIKKRNILENVWDSEWFFEVRQYRNFAHRAFLYIQFEFDCHFGNSKPTLKRIWLLPAREGQPDYIDLSTQLSDYLENLKCIGMEIFR